MTHKDKPRPTLDRPATYEIRVPVELDKKWSDWDGEMTVTVEVDDEGRPITVLTATLDQAGLQGLLRRLYALGIPLVSVRCTDAGGQEEGYEGNRL